MPHRVVDFFRSPTDNIHTIKQTVKRRTSPASRPQQPARTSSYASSTEGSISEDHTSHTTPPAVGMPDPGKENRRLSLLNLLPGHKTNKEPTHTDASLDWKIESPPVLLLNHREESSGALVSGQMLLRVREEPVEFESFDAKLEMVVTQKKPFNSHCNDCATQRTELKKWSFVSEPTTLTKRTHEFPFSILLEGHLPATTDSHILSIKYEFTARARRHSNNLPALKLIRTIDVRRALPVPDAQHHSLRVFPPTEITANMHYDSVVHPMGKHNLTLRLDGIGKRNADQKSVEYWKLKRLSWKLEEQVTSIAPACAKHVSKNIGVLAGQEGVDAAAAAAAAAKKERNDTRVLASADLHSGWKADYMAENGNVEAEIEYQIPGVNSPSSSYNSHSSSSTHNSRPVSCDVTTRDGSVSISHRLVVEMVVAQEYAPIAHPRQVTPTGVARILRMNFSVVVTERAGLGISWDNEAPPIYQDVPPSPPSYANTVIHGSVEDLTLPIPGASPPYTEYPVPRGGSPVEPQGGPGASHSQS